MARAHLNLTPQQALGYALQWWDNRLTADGTGRYTAYMWKATEAEYRVTIRVINGVVSEFSVNIKSGYWTLDMYNRGKYNKYKHGTLGLYKRQDLSALFRQCKRFLEHK